MIKKIFQIARYTYIENVKRKNFIILFVFIGVVLGSGILFSMLSPEQEIRIILDIGIAAVEIFAFLSCAFIAVKLILQEMEDKTVYLILTRPIPRPYYILGRYFGILSVIFTYIVIMTGSLVAMLLAKGWTWHSYIAGMALSIFFKVMIVAAFSILISLVSTSSASSFISIFFLWGLGHFAEELKYLNRLLVESGVKITFLLKGIYYILPNFSKLNYKDVFQLKESCVTSLVCPGGYAILYSAVLIVLSILIFKNKEL